MLQEFKNDIYPRKLWVATSWEDVKDKFVSHGGYEFEKSEDAYATTYPQMMRKKTGESYLSNCTIALLFNQNNYGSNKRRVGSIYVREEW